MRIVIDNREPESLINIFSTAVEQRYKNITIETANLTIGDFQIFKTNSPVPDIIIERKSINDLLASIKDGRYNEQSFRLDKYDLHNHNIYYIKTPSYISLIILPIFTLSSLSLSKVNK